MSAFVIPISLTAENIPNDTCLLRVIKHKILMIIHVCSSKSLAINQGVATVKYDIIRRYFRSMHCKVHNAMYNGHLHEYVIMVFLYNLRLTNRIIVMSFFVLSNNNVSS